MSCQTPPLRFKSSFSHQICIFTWHLKITAETMNFQADITVYKGKLSPQLESLSHYKTCINHQRLSIHVLNQIYLIICRGSAISLHYTSARTNGSPKARPNGRTAYLPPAAVWQQGHQAEAAYSPSPRLRANAVPLNLSQAAARVHSKLRQQRGEEG